VTARALRGVDMIRDAALAAPPAVHVLILDGLPRTGLSVKEVAKISGRKEDRIRRAARNGEIRADRTGQALVIPVSELATIDKWADYEHTA
jgi:hypothetical protein